MAIKPVGGRGKSAPYDTKLMRVPVPLQGQVKELVERYYAWLDTLDSNGSDASNPPFLLDTNKPVNSLIETEIKPVNELSETQNQDSTPRCDELIKIDISPKPMGLRELAERLGVPRSTLSDWNKKPGFELKTRTKDPDNFSWRYDSSTKKYHPIQ